MTKVVISACTYRRPQGLQEMFDSLATIKIPGDIELCTRIIDNDDTPSSKQLVEQIAARMPFTVHYVHESEPGIPSARNRALTEAKNEDFLVFIDDDETVDADWLMELWTVQKRTKAQFVQGPVTPTVEKNTDEWWIKSLFFKQRTFPDGAERKESWSNNVMIDMKFIRQNDVKFDMSLRYDGGSDTLFFQDIIRKSGKGVFAAKAIVYEVQPESRLTWKWALTRQFRYGTTRALCALLRQKRWKARTQCLARAAACAGVGVLLLPLSLIKGRIGLANASAYCARAAGIVWGLLGKRHLEYERQPVKAS